MSPEGLGIVTYCAGVGLTFLLEKARNYGKKYKLTKSGIQEDFSLDRDSSDPGVYVYIPTGTTTCQSYAMQQKDNMRARGGLATPTRLFSAWDSKNIMEMLAKGDYPSGIEIVHQECFFSTRPKRIRRATDDSIGITKNGGSYRRGSV